MLTKIWEAGPILFIQGKNEQLGAVNGLFSVSAAPISPSNSQIITQNAIYAIITSSFQNAAGNPQPGACTIYQFDLLTGDLLAAETVPFEFNFTGRAMISSFGSLWTGELSFGNNLREFVIEPATSNTPLGLSFTGLEKSGSLFGGTIGGFLMAIDDQRNTFLSGFDDELNVYDWTTGQLKYTYSGLTGLPVNTAALGLDEGGRVYLLGRDRTIALFDYEKGEVLGSVKLEQFVPGVTPLYSEVLAVGFAWDPVLRRFLVMTPEPNDANGKSTTKIRAYSPNPVPVRVTTPIPLIWPRKGRIVPVTAQIVGDMGEGVGGFQVDTAVVISGSQTFVNFNLIVSQTGNLLAGVTVTINQDFGNGTTRITDASGFANFGVLDGSLINYSLVCPGYISQSLDVSISGATTVSITMVAGVSTPITLPPPSVGAFVNFNLVVSQAGVPLQGVVVTLNQDFGNGATRTTDASGFVNFGVPDKAVIYYSLICPGFVSIESNITMSGDMTVNPVMVPGLSTSITLPLPSSPSGLIGTPISDNLGRIIANVNCADIGNVAISCTVTLSNDVIIPIVGIPPVDIPPVITGGPPPVPGPPGPTGPANYDINLGQPGGVPDLSSNRWMRANFGGIRIPGLPNVPEGPDTTQTGGMLWTPYYDRFTDAGVRGDIRTQYVNSGLTHFLMSWVDSQRFGTTASGYANFTQEIFGAGLKPVHFISAKASGPQDPAGILASWRTVLSAFFGFLGPPFNLVPIVCVGWELNSWMSPADLQTLIDGLVALGMTEANGHALYVHFTGGYMSWPLPGGDNAAFWKANVGKLSGVLSQQDGTAADADLQARIADSLSRAAGNDGIPTDSGFGHPFDVVAWEYAANDEFFNGKSEAKGDSQGFALICQPAITGPAGTVRIMGYGNGCKTLSGGKV